MKKIVSLLLALCLLAGCLPIVTGAQEIDADIGAWYELSGVEDGLLRFNEETGTIIDCEDTVTSANIPSSIGGVAVTGIGEQAFCDCYRLTNIVIPETVTEIGKDAFQFCTSLTDVTIPSKVTAIGEGAFALCYELTSVKISEGVRTIGEDAFSMCDNLSSITLPSSVVAIGYGAFSSCSKLTEIKVASENTYYCSIDGVLFSKNLKTLHEFPGGKEGTYEIPSGVTRVSDKAFYQCNLTSVTIPNSVTVIGEYAFFGLSFCTDVYYAGTRAQWNAIDGSWNTLFEDATIHYQEDGSGTEPDPLPDEDEEWITVPGIEGGRIKFDKSTGTIIDCEETVTSANIPSTIDGVAVKKIGNGAFGSVTSTSLTSVTIPSSVTEIGISAFENCTNLTSVTIPNTVTKIGHSAFRSCKSLTSVTIPSSVTEIRGSTFENCTSLTSVTIPSSVTGIWGSAFENCTSLTSVTIPSSVTEIGDNAFTNTTLTDVYYGGSRAQWEELWSRSFYENDAIYQATIHFEDGTAVGWLTVPGIEGGRIKFDKSTGTIIDCAETVTSANIPSTIDGVAVKKIGIEAFRWCDDLTSVTIPSSVVDIGFNAFGDCSSLTAIEVAPENTTYCSVDGVLFSKDKHVLYVYPAKKAGTAYEIPDSVTEIYISAFYQCDNLTSLTIPISVALIYGEAFCGCSSDIYYAGTLAQWKIIDIEWSSKNSVVSNMPLRTSRIHFEGEAKRDWLAVPGIEGGCIQFDRETGAIIDCEETVTTANIPSVIDGVKVVKIEDYAFSHCESLADVTFPGSITEIGASAFNCCNALSSVTIPEGVIKIGGYAFSGEKLTTVTLPSSIKWMEYHAFINAFSITDVYYSGTPSQWSAINPFIFIRPTIHYINEGSGDLPAEEPVVETKPTGNGNTATITTQPGGDKEIEVKTPAGETVAKVNLPADPGEGKKFEDVKAGEWYVEAVDSATAYGLFNGTSDTTFSPNDAMTRGMLAQTLYNLSGKTSYGVGEGSFTDVKDGAWYENAVDWAAKAGVTSGTGNGGFSPEQNITREQLVTMLYRYAKVIGTPGKGSETLENFPDSAKVSDFAREAMQWAVEKGIITGRSSHGTNYIAPQGTATRAEVAAVLTRFVEYLK